MRRVIDFLRDEEGATAVEYAVALALICVVCVAAALKLGSAAGQVFQQVGGAVGTYGN